MILTCAQAALMSAVLLHTPPVSSSCSSELSRCGSITGSIAEPSVSRTHVITASNRWCTDTRGWRNANPHPFSYVCAATAPPSASRRRKWAPLLGAAVGGTIMGIAVADEEDLVFSGKAAWVGIGAAGGAAVGWLIGRIAGG